MGTYADFDDVAARHDESIPASRTSWVEALIGEAEAVLAVQVPNLASRVALDPTAAGYLDLALVKTVVVRAVLRTYVNPRGYASEGDGTYQYQRMASAGGGDVSFSRADLVLLGVVSPVRTVGMVGLSPWLPAPVEEEMA